MRYCSGGPWGLPGELAWGVPGASLGRLWGRLWEPLGRPGGIDPGDCDSKTINNIILKNYFKNILRLELIFCYEFVNCICEYYF